jgi:hypothetical protein
MFIENCNIRGTSDNGTCMVGHPDHIQPNGLMQYTRSRWPSPRMAISPCLPCSP